MRKKWGVKNEVKYPDGGGGASVGGPYFLPVAHVVKWFTLLPLSWKSSVVNYDDEMRAWGRYDWVHTPTSEDLRLAREMQKYVIPHIPPGGSVQIQAVVRERGSSPSLCTSGDGAS